MAKTVYLHVGTHKTGTTSIQSYLKDHKNAFRRQGMLFVEARIAKHDGSKALRNRNSTNFAHHFLRGELLTGTRWRSGSPENLARKCAEAAASIEDIIRASDLSRFIISSEAFCFMRSETEASRLRAFFEALECAIRPIIVFRNAADWRTSFTAQLQKSNFAESRATVAQPDLRADGDWYYDRQAIIAFWSAFGAPIIIDYDEAMRTHASILPPFLDALGLEAPDDHEAYTLNAREPASG